ncbi:MAG: NAD(P) transhydrogenase subunit alpha [Alphaproteobacteria bacterium]|nr:NAD(P) transhydrogenase subunit alpha [Alphaproteobacteria bacterium]
MDTTSFAASLAAIAATQEDISRQLSKLAEQTQDLAPQTISMASGGFFITGLTIFVLACFVGYYVVWRVTPALHSPLMAVTNAISSVIIVGALVAAGLKTLCFASWLGLVAVFLASINIFGGFIVTARMLHMYKKKAK